MLSIRSCHLAAAITAEKAKSPQNGTRRVARRMWNFLLGVASGALIAGILTITAARQPEFQTRMGLVPAALPLTPASARAVEPQCRQDPATTSSAAKVQDMLFNKQRFWSVAP
ncbi:O-antigen/teichoic acid export membrane protein [Methylobacterium persicinum]|uniref:O-antigen/teichoic acid export membrane protein n=1 Tax=Methylobacterium persicinum TaxID=374426 RepID=A0ABU0HIY1_9HYPH|nr:O-antigen/teichoic acid export membrane protein [Methylobacterium persicinum]GJE37264.1 hypothetical protein KHHGKMAE_1320 [Methylobacterium persicinum]